MLAYSELAALANYQTSLLAYVYLAAPGHYCLSLLYYNKLAAFPDYCTSLLAYIHLASLSNYCTTFYSYNKLVVVAHCLLLHFITFLHRFGGSHSVLHLRKLADLLIIAPHYSPTTS